MTGLSLEALQLLSEKWDELHEADGKKPGGRKGFVVSAVAGKDVDLVATHDEYVSADNPFLASILHQAAIRVEKPKRVSKKSGTKPKTA